MISVTKKTKPSQKEAASVKRRSACRLSSKSAFGFCGDLANLFAQSSALAFKFGSSFGNCLKSFPAIGLDSTLQVADYFFYGFHLDTSQFFK
jgi:hypothetical protein